MIKEIPIKNIKTLKTNRPLNCGSIPESILVKADATHPVLIDGMLRYEAAKMRGDKVLLAKFENYINQNVSV